MAEGRVERAAIGTRREAGVGERAQRRCDFLEWRSTVLYYGMIWRVCAALCVGAALPAVCVCVTA